MTTSDKARAAIAHAELMVAGYRLGRVCFNTVAQAKQDMAAAYRTEFDNLLQFDYVAAVAKCDLVAELEGGAK